MNPDRWRSVYELFNELLALPPSERETVLNDRCAEDPELREEVQRLLARHAEAEREDFLVPPPSTVVNGSPAIQPLGIRIRCPNCRAAIELLDPQAAREVQCTACGSTILVDRPEDLTWNRRLHSARVSRFRLLEPVGTGAFGTVYKAHDPELDRVVAIKLLRQGHLASSNQLARFLEDARSSARLRHEGIVPVHEAGEFSGIPYIVRDFVPGVTVSEWIKQVRPGFRDAARVVAEVALALQHAHDRGVIHRDVKSPNILIDEQGKAHLLDFGLAKREAGEVTLTLEGQILGTPAYMSPEQARGDTAVIDRRSDVYSLGVVLYECLTGDLPFRGNVRMLLDQVVRDDPRPPRQLNDRVPRDLETICLKAMAKEPSRRYQTAAELAADLRRYLAREPIRARPVGTLERAARWCRRNPALAGSLAATAAALVAAALLSLLYAANRALRLTDARGHLALVSFELGREACERGEVGPGLHWLWQSLKAGTEAGDASWVRLANQNLVAWRRELPELLGLFSHDGEVKFAAFSPDGRTLLTAGADRTARFWDAAAAAPLGQPLEHASVVWFAVFSPDGATALTTSLGGEVHLWDVPAGSLKHDLKGHKGEVYGAVFSGDGQTLVTACQDGKARLWDARSGGLRLELTGPARRLTSIAVSDDGQTILAGSDDGTAWLWDAATGKSRGTPLSHPPRVDAVDLSRDGRFALTGGPDHTARLWDAANGKLLQTLRHEDEVWQVAFSPDATLLATGGADRTARLWERSTGRPIGAPLRHGDRVTVISFRPDGQVLLTASWDRTARLWDARTGRPLGRLFRHESRVNHASFSPDGRQVLTAGADRVARLWDARIEDPWGWTLPRPGSIATASYSPDGRSILVGTRDGTLFVCDADSAGERPPSVPLGEPVTCLAWSPDGTRVAAGGERGAFRLWTVANGRVLGPPLPFTDRITSIRFHPGGALVLVTSKDGKAQLVDGKTGQPGGLPLQQSQPIFTSAISPDGTVGATAGLDGGVILWDPETGQRRGLPLEHPGLVVSLAFRPDSRRLLTGCMDGRVREWDLRTGRIADPPLSDEGAVLAVAYSPDGTTFAAGGMGGRVRIWDARTRAPVGRPMVHSGLVCGLGYSPDGRTLVTAGKDSLVRLWDAATGRPIGPALTRPVVARGPTLDEAAASFRPDGRAVLAVLSDGSAVVRTVIPEQPPEYLLTPWVEPATGLTLEDGVVRVLDTTAWAARAGALRRHSIPASAPRGHDR